ncbi:unnamed protein product [Prunus armeniaca]|uniref:Uncharacterized protein n=1 Tax=Prunus armeniaca TaxID=36596 RepID=A0A6J5WHM1_PRUAR|nr:unnamed protein product [Prunus armeniaca]
MANQTTVGTANYSLTGLPLISAKISQVYQPRVPNSSFQVFNNPRLQIEKKEKRHRYKAHQVKGRKHSSTASTTDTIRELVFPIMSYALDTRHPIVWEVDDRACKSPQITYIRFAIHLPFSRKAKRDMPHDKP